MRVRKWFAAGTVFAGVSVAGVLAEPLMPLPRHAVPPDGSQPVVPAGAEIDKTTAALKEVRRQKEAMVRDEQERVKAYLSAVAKLAEREASLLADLKRQVDQLNTDVKELGVTADAEKVAWLQKQKALTRGAVKEQKPASDERDVK